MQPFHVWLQFTVLLSLAALYSACQGPVAPADVAGVYTLTSVTGAIGASETPVSGTLSLTAQGAAERLVRYSVDTTGTLREVLAVGTFRVVDSLVQFTLRADSGQSPFVWYVTATVESDGGLRLTYPRAADGTIAELYER